MTSSPQRGQSLWSTALTLLLASVIAVTANGCAPVSEESGTPTAPATPELSEDSPHDGESSNAAEGDTTTEGGSADPASHSAGEITLSWTGGTEHQNFTYMAEQCYVGTDYILVEGVGGPIDTPKGSRIKIFTTPEELLHEATGTFQADGSIHFTWEDFEIIADGRQIHVGDYPQPAVFTYRQTEDSVKYVVSWFEGAKESGAGAVEVQCTY